MRHLLDRALVVAGAAMVAGCSSAPVACNAACQVPVLIRFTAAQVAAGDTLRVCIAGQGCHTYPLSREPIARMRAVGIGLPPAAYQVRGTLHHQGRAEHARIRLHVSASDQPCSCPQASGTLRFGHGPAPARMHMAGRAPHEAADSGRSPWWSPMSARRPAGGQEHGDTFR